MIPTQARLDEGNTSVVLPEGTVLEKAVELLAIPGSKQSEGIWLAALWNGIEFEAIPVNIRHSRGDRWLIQFAETDQHQPLVTHHDYRMELRYPIDAGTIAKDWARATSAEHNSDGTAWLPVWDNDSMVDYEKQLVAAVVGQYQPDIDAAQVKVNEATNAPVRATSVTRHQKLVEFRDEVREAVIEWVHGKHAGWPQQNPHEAHTHEPMLLATQTVAATWQRDRSSDYGNVSSPVANIINCLLYTSPSPRDS